MFLDPVAAFFLTVAAAAVGGFVFFKLRIPAGPMIGAMIAVVLFNVFTESANFPADLRKYVQILSGILIGSRIKRKDLTELRQVLVPAVILLSGMFVLNIVFAVLFTQIGGLGLTTALFAAAPGGMSDMALIAEDLGANTAHVALLQLSRVLFIIMLFPLIFKGLAARGWKLFGKKTVTAAGTGRADPEKTPVEDAAACDRPPAPPSFLSHFRSETGSLRLPTRHIARLAVTLLLAAAGGFALYAVGVPAGAMIGAMIATAAFSITSKHCYFPTGSRPFIQIAIGAFLGARISLSTLVSLKDLLVPALIMLAGVITASFVLGFIMNKLTGLPLPTCLFSCTPGGLAEMSLIAEDMGCDAPKIAVLHTFRLTMVILLFPTMIRIMAAILL